MKEKVESALSRLDRLKVEGGAEGDGEEPKHRVILFEYVSSMVCERVHILTFSSSGLLKEWKTDYGRYLIVPRKTIKTCRPSVDLRRMSGMPSSSTRSVIIPITLGIPS